MRRPLTAFPMSKRQPKIILKKSPNFRRVYAVGAFGGHSQWDFRITFFNEAPRYPEEAALPLQVTEVERIAEVEVILAPVAAKQLANWLNKLIAQYEQAFGEIKVGKKPSEEERGFYV